MKKKKYRVQKSKERRERDGLQERDEMQDINTMTTINAGDE